MPDASVRSQRVWTLPNLISLTRLLGVPVFLWLVLGPEADGWALALLMVSGITDFLDGYLARKYNLVTTFGKLRIRRCRSSTLSRGKPDSSR